MLNFVELMSHLGDAPTKTNRSPFNRYRAAFRRVYKLFDGVLPSAESVLMRGVGLKEHTGEQWIVDGSWVEYQVKVIAEANSLEEVLRVGMNPAHYKALRARDKRSFLDVVAEARQTITDLVQDSHAGGRLLVQFYRYLIFRASSEAIQIEKLSDQQNLAVIAFFDQAGGKMFLSHFIKLLTKMIHDGAKDDANDFYDMLQLLLLADTNLLFVTEDRPFFQYYVGAEHHRIVRWKAFKIA